VRYDFCATLRVGFGAASWVGLVGACLEP